MRMYKIIFLYFTIFIEFFSKMAYKSRNKKYNKNKGERIREHWNNLRILVLFALLVLAILIFKNRVSIWTYLQTYFY